jgi:integration host factor subunit beta
MTRDKFIQSIRKRCPTVELESVKLAVDTFFEEVQRTLVGEGKVELRRFGIFSIRQRDARKARNPNNGQDVPLPARKYLHFKMSKNLQKEIN